MKTSIWESVRENAEFLGVFLLIIISLSAVAWMAEAMIDRKNGAYVKGNSTKKLTIVGVFSAIGAILMFFEFPIFFAPAFYELDFSEVPVLICAFSMGPVAGVAAELVKIILKTLLKGTSTAFVGELANFVVGCSFIVPAAIIYRSRKAKKTAVIGVAAGTLVMTVFGSLFNAVYLLPAFSKLYGMPLDTIVAMGTAVNKNITSAAGLVLFAVVPMNLLKGTLVSAITILIYKKISIILK